MAKSNGNAVAPVAEKARAKSKSEYLNDNGESNRSPQADTTVLRFTFEGVTEPVDLRIDDLSQEIQHFAICQGANIKLQRSYNTAAGNTAQMAEECAATRDNLLAGIWTSEREGGLRIGDLATAVVAVLAEEGKTVSLDDVKAKLAADEATREKAKKNPKVAAKVAAIVAAKALERANAAATSAESHTAESGLDF